MNKQKSNQSKRKVYTQEFKQGAIDIVLVEGNTVTDVSERLGVRSMTLRQ